MSEAKIPKLYLRSYKKIVECNSRAGKEISNQINAKRKKRQRHGECNCTKAEIAYCDGDCECCEHYTPSNVSFETKITSDLTLAEVITDEVTLEEQYELNDQRRRLYAAIPKLKDNVDVQIINLYLQDYTIREIGEIVQLQSTSSVQYRLEKAINELKTLV